MSENESGYVDPAEMSPEERDQLELKMLKEQAVLMGLKFHPNTGLEKMRILVKEAKEASTDDPEVGEKRAEEQATIQEAAETAGADTFTPMQKQTPKQLQAQRRKEAMALVRIRMTNMNPVNTNLRGVIPSVGNADVGFIKKFVPFNVPWHVPKVILNYLKGKKFVTHYEVNDPSRPGKKLKRKRLVPEYAIEVLPPLTEQELQDLAQRQAMRDGTRTDEN